MGRKLMRVPLDFNYPLHKRWEGYAPSLEKLKSIKEIVSFKIFVKILLFPLFLS